MTPESGGLLDPQSFVGRRVDDVVGSWYVNETGVHDLVHVWLNLDGLGYVRVHPNGGIRLTIDQPHASYAMPDLNATVEVDRGTPAPLAAIVGGTITRVGTLRMVREAFDVGCVIETELGSVAIADVGDDLAIGVWPDSERWDAAGITLAQ